MGTNPRNDPKFKVVRLRWKLVHKTSRVWRIQKSRSQRPKMMTSPNRIHLATVAKDEKQGFRTSNEREISRVRQVRCADYEKSDPETWNPKDRPRPGPTPRKIQSRQIDVELPHRPVNGDSLLVTHFESPNTRKFIGHFWVTNQKATRKKRWVIKQTSLHMRTRNV